MVRYSLTAWLLASLSCVASARTVFDPLSPFYLYSTSPLNIPENDIFARDTPASYSDVYHKLIAPVLGSCPTKHYVVVLQPSVSSNDYDGERMTPFLSRLANSHRGMKIPRVKGQVNDNWTLNTILMDCLHHGITRVEEVNVKYGESVETYMALGKDREMIEKSVMFVRFPAIQKPEVEVMNFDGLLQGMVYRWFGYEDYTLIWISEARTEEPDTEGDGKLGEGEDQKPLLGE